MKTCFIDAGIFIEDESLIEAIKEYSEVSVFHGIPENIDEVVKRGFDADIIAFGMMQFTNDMLDALPNLKVLQFIGTGVWNFVNKDYADKKGIKVLNIDGYGSNAVAEFAIAMAFNLSKNIVRADKVLKSKAWSIDGLKGMEFTGSTFGVIGTGSIGRLVAIKAKALGCHVIACDLYENQQLIDDYGVDYMPMEQVFEKSDIVSIHMKSTNDNQGIINESFLKLMKPGALLINVARAELVNNEDLFKFLQGGHISGAAIDVYESEPPSEVDYELAALDNVVATPHIAYYTQEANDNSVLMSVQSIIDNL